MMMNKLILAVVSLLSVTGFVIASPVAEPAPQLGSIATLPLVGPLLGGLLGGAAGAPPAAAAAATPAEPAD